MEEVFGLKNVLARKYRLPSVTIGIFDGVHLGHQKVIAPLVTTATVAGGESVVLTFDHHPDSVLCGKRTPLITSLRHRLVLLGNLGVDVSCVLHFDQTLCKMSAPEFVERILVDGLGARRVFLGFNSTFGKDAQGDVALLRDLSGRFGFDVQEVPPVYCDGEVVSSSAIRELVTVGNLDKASRFLGRPVSVLGTVIRGSGRGRNLGFPTVNLDLHHEVRPPDGVYAVRVVTPGPDMSGPQHHHQRIVPIGFPVARAGLCNIGTRPSFADSTDTVVEIHILDFSGDLYGADVDVQFIRKLREEKRFASPEELVRDIRGLIERCRAESVFGMVQNRVT